MASRIRKPIIAIPSAGRCAVGDALPVGAKVRRRTDAAGRWTAGAAPTGRAAQFGDMRLDEVLQEQWMHAFSVRPGEHASEWQK
ncbi:MAG: hypothetical protein ACJ735_07685 [Actinomycetes bacterium]